MLGNQIEWLMLTRNQQRGVTLIELMVSIIIVSLLFALAARSYSGWIQNQQIRTAAESILNGIQLTRSEAVKNNGLARFVLCNPPDSSWQVLAASAAAAAPAATLTCGAGNAGEIRVQERSGQEGSQFALVNAVDLTNTNANTVTFNGFGRVVANTDGSPVVAIIDISTLTGDRPLRVTVGLGGNTRMCDPSPLLSATDPRHC